MAWGVVAEDFDNDGDEDLFIANRSGFGGRQPLSQLYRNDGGIFTNVAAKAGAAFRREASGVASGDFDNDGRRDLVVTDLASGSKNLLLRNTSAAGHWAAFRLEGRTTNRSAVGARLRVVAGGRSQVRTVTAGSSYASQVSSTLHVGLGTSSEIDTVDIRWPSGSSQLFTRVSVDRVHALVEGGSLTGMDADQKPSVPRSFLLRAYPNPFNSATIVELDLGERQDLRIEVYDVLGRRQATMHEGSLSAGTHRWPFHAGGLPSGMYLLRAVTAGEVRTVRMLLVR
jgi:hypothetical protein